MLRNCKFKVFEHFFVTFQISNPELPPMTLQGHSEEVTSVAWCPTDFTKVRLEWLYKYEHCCELEEF